MVIWLSGSSLARARLSSAQPGPARLGSGQLNSARLGPVWLGLALPSLPRLLSAWAWPGLASAQSFFDFFFQPRLIRLFHIYMGVVKQKNYTF